MTLAQAVTEGTALRACEAFNTIRHSKNSGNLRLETGADYRILREQDGQYYISVPGASVPNRWVDESCIARSGNSERNHKTEPEAFKMSSNAQGDAFPSTVPKPKEMLLALSWHNAFCQTHPTKKECRQQRSPKYSDSRFVLHGLWPQPRENIYCNVPPRLKELDRRYQWHRLPRLPLSDGTLTALLHLMPGSASNLHRHEWIKHGTCSGLDPESYFREAVSLTEQVNRSKVGEFFRSNIGKKVTLRQIRFKVDESFGKGSGKKVEMLCHRGLITELRFHLGNGSGALSELLKNGQKVRSRCRQGRIDRAGLQ